MKILNLYAGIGGNRKLWGDEHDITAVELNPDIAKVYQDFFPDDTVIVDNAHEYLLKHHKEFDFIWSSPPCQSHSRMMKATRHNVIKYPDLKLYEEIIFLTNFFKAPFVVENVTPYYTPLIEPSNILSRHFFWSNFVIHGFKQDQPKDFITLGTVADTQKLKDWLGLNYKGNLYYSGNHCPGQVLRNCVHPKLGKHILDCATGAEIKTEELELF